VIPYILDTDILTLLQEAHPLVCQRVSAHPPANLAVTVISIEEQLSGWFRALRKAKKRDEVARVYQRLADRIRTLAGLRIVSFTVAAIVRFEQLKAMKLNIGKMDLRIAAITLEMGGTLVSRNLRDFQRIPSLAVENWAL
jgi:tRNA(fMet)-specific endonuclease VapC